MSESIEALRAKQTELLNSLEDIKKQQSALDAEIEKTKEQDRQPELDKISAEIKTFCSLYDLDEGEVLIDLALNAVPRSFGAKIRAVKKDMEKAKKGGTKSKGSSAPRVTKLQILAKAGYTEDMADKTITNKQLAEKYGGSDSTHNRIREEKSKESSSESSSESTSEES